MDKYVVHIYNGIITQPQKKNKIMPISAAWMDLKIIILSNVSFIKDKHHMISLICGSLKGNK